MNLYVRLLRVLLGGWFKASTHYADTTTSDVVEKVHVGAESPRIPQYVKEWVELEDKMYRRGSQFHTQNNNSAALREVC